MNLQQCRNELKIMIKVLIISLFMTTLVGSKSVHNFKVHDLSGKEVQLNMYKGKVLLIVNTASECGFTPQYEELEAIYQLYKNKGFEVLAFPSNDFGGQEPLNGNEIQQFCSVKFHTTFPIFDKIHVKGKNANPLYSFLSNKSQNGNVNIAPKWNFQKYLIDKNGHVIDYYLSTTSPTSAKVKKAIEALLAK
jgi:glutathione peroxidase